MAVIDRVWGGAMAVIDRVWGGAMAVIDRESGIEVELCDRQGLVVELYQIVDDRTTDKNVLMTEVLDW